jgi:hypothetical protein
MRGERERERERSLLDSGVERNLSLMMFLITKIIDFVFNGFHFIRGV